MFAQYASAAQPVAALSASVGPLLPPPDWQLPAIDEFGNPRYYTWAFVTAAEVALWTVVGVPLWQDVVRRAQLNGVRRVFGNGLGRSVAAAFFVELLLVMPALVSHLFWPPEKLVIRDPLYRERSFALSLLGFVAVIPAISRIWRVYLDAATIKGPSTEAHGVQPNAPDLANYLRLRRDLQDDVSVLGLMTATATVAIAALRSALNAPIASFVDVSKAGVVDLRKIPPEAVVVYGLYLTMVYVPAYLRLISAGWCLVDGAAPLPDPINAAEWQAAFARRKALEDYMTLNASPADNLKAGISILAPFVASLAGAFGGPA